MIVMISDSSVNEVVEIIDTSEEEDADDQEDSEDIPYIPSVKEEDKLYGNEMSEVGSQASEDNVAEDDSENNVTHIPNKTKEDNVAHLPNEMKDNLSNSWGVNILPDDFLTNLIEENYDSRKSRKPTLRKIVMAHFKPFEMHKQLPSGSDANRHAIVMATKGYVDRTMIAC